MKASAHAADLLKGTPFCVWHAAVQQFQRNEYTACSMRQDPKIVRQLLCFGGLASPEPPCFSVGLGLFLNQRTHGLDRHLGLATQCQASSLQSLQDFTKMVFVFIFMSEPGCHLCTSLQMAVLAARSRSYVEKS